MWEEQLKKYEIAISELMDEFKQDPECKKHMDLLLEAFYTYIENAEDESKGIGLDGKRPFGNSFIAGDVAEIIGIEFGGEDEGNEAIEEYCDWLYYHLWAYIKYNYETKRYKLKKGRRQ